MGKRELSELDTLFTYSLLGVDTNNRLRQMTLSDEDFAFAKLIFEQRNDIIAFEEPDMILKTDDVIYGIEMFEFDASKKNKHKGSSFRREEAQIDRNAQHTKHYEEMFKTNFNLKNYRDNLIGSFREHYSNIGTYLVRLEKDMLLKEQMIKICFVIVD